MSTGPAPTGSSDSDAVIAELKARIAELEAQIAEANKRIAELEAQLRAAPDAVQIEKLTAELESARSAQSPDLKAALEAKEQELKQHYQSQLQTRYDDGKHEATLRNTIMLKLRDEKIKKLTAEISGLKGESAGEQEAQAAPTPTVAPAPAAALAPAAPAAPAADAGSASEAQTDNSSGTKQTPKGKVARGGSTAAARGGRGGHTGPKPVPIIKGAGKEVTSIRGAAAGRGARGSARGGHVAQSKRKRDGEAAQDSGNASKAAAAKKSRGDAAKDST